jgi:hypothetical protein
MIADLRRQADDAAQAAFRARQEHHERTGRWDVHLTREYRRLEMVVEMLDERILLEEAAAHDAACFDPAEGSPDPVPDVPLADPGDIFVFPAGVGR